MGSDDDGKLRARGVSGRRVSDVWIRIDKGDGSESHVRAKRVRALCERNGDSYEQAVKGRSYQTVAARYELVTVGLVGHVDDVRKVCP